jgi:hypothetical protein
MSIKSGRGRLSSTNSLTEKTLRNCPCEYAAWPPSCQSPTCQSPTAISRVPDFESIALYAAISGICSQSKESVTICCGISLETGERNWVKAPLRDAQATRDRQSEGDTTCSVRSLISAELVGRLRLTDLTAGGACDENPQFEGSSRRVENPTEPSSSVDAKGPQKSPQKKELAPAPLPSIDAELTEGPKP